MGRIFFLSPPAVRGSLTLGWRGLCHSRGSLPFFLMPLMSTGGRAFQRLRPPVCVILTSCHFFAIELTQGPNLRFPNLHVTRPIKRPQLGAPCARGAQTAPCEGAVGCRGKVVAKCYGCERVGLCAAHKDGLYVPRQEGEEPEGGEEEGVEDPNGVIEQCVYLFLDRPFEWDIHGTVNSTTFSCVLRVTSCHRLRVSCYLRPKRGPTNVCKLQVLSSHMVQHIW